jgi:two-component system NtrC family response regulator
MSPAMQAKLLRVLQDQTFERVGGTKTLNIDTRIIAATNRDLPGLVREGCFREDLFYRLNVIQIQLPPLRERRDDIPLLVTHFMNKFRSLYPSGGEISKQALELLLNYHWPGNVRELQNVIERALILSQGDPITPAHLPVELKKGNNHQKKAPFEIPDEGISLEEVEKQLIMAALEKSGGNQTKAAALLNVTRATLLYRLQKYGLA